MIKLARDDNGGISGASEIRQQHTKSAFWGFSVLCGIKRYHCSAEFNSSIGMQCNGMKKPVNRIHRQQYHYGGIDYKHIRL